MTDWVTSFIEAVGYPGIVVLMVLEIPIPLIQSEIVMTFSGFAASRGGQLDIVAVALAGIVGSQAGSLALYGVARRASEQKVNDVLSRYGGWLGFDCDDLESAEERFERHDVTAVLIGRLVPGLRSFISLPAGLRNMGFWQFFGANLAGTTFWVVVLTWLGSILGSNYGSVEQYSSYITTGLLVALGLFVAYRIVVVVKHKAGAD